MRTTRSSSRSGGGLHQAPPRPGTPWHQTPPGTRYSPSRDHTPWTWHTTPPPPRGSQYLDLNPICAMLKKSVCDAYPEIHSTKDI